MKAIAVSVNGHMIVQLPVAMSAALPSRGMVMGEGTVNGASVTVPLEPDGRGGHWFMIGDLPTAVHLKVDEPIDIDLHSTNDWPDPVMPDDIMKAFNADPVSRDMYANITPKARWEWLRWIRSTNNPETRQKRINVSIDKMHKGMRRPCCFDQGMCTVVEVAKNGLLNTGDM